MTKYKAQITIEINAESMDEAADIIILTLENLNHGKGHLTISDNDNTMGQSF